MCVCMCKRFINLRHTFTARVTVVGYVCLSVTLHLDSQMSVRLKNDTAYLMGNEGQKVCGNFSENVLILRYGIICLSQQCVCPYLVCMATVASLLVRKANEILSTTISRPIYIPINV